MKKILLSLLALLGSCVEVEGFGGLGLVFHFPKIIVCYSTKDKPDERKVVFYDGIFPVKDELKKGEKEFFGREDISTLLFWDSSKKEWNNVPKYWFLGREIKSLIENKAEMLHEGEDLLALVKQAYEDDEVYEYISGREEVVKSQFSAWNPIAIFSICFNILFWGGIIYWRVQKKRRKRLAEAAAKQVAEVGKKEENAPERKLQV